MLCSLARAHTHIHTNAEWRTEFPPRRKDRASCGKMDREKERKTNNIFYFISNLWLLDWEFAREKINHFLFHSVVSRFIPIVCHGWLFGSMLHTPRALFFSHIQFSARWNTHTHTPTCTRSWTVFKFSVVRFSPSSCHFSDVAKVLPHFIRNGPSEVGRWQTHAIRLCARYWERPEIFSRTESIERISSTLSMPNNSNSLLDKCALSTHVEHYMLSNAKKYPTTTISIVLGSENASVPTNAIEKHRQLCASYRYARIFWQYIAMRWHSYS